MQANYFLDFFPFSEMLVFEAAILANKQKMRIFEMLPIQFMICKIKASFVPSSRPLLHPAQFLDVSAAPIPEINFPRFILNAA